MKLLRLLLAITVLASLSACASAANPGVDPAVHCDMYDLSGFFSGFWHGLVAPIAFWFSLGSSSIGVYDVCNSGGWYDFGFVFSGAMNFMLWLIYLPFSITKSS